MNRAYLYQCRFSSREQEMRSEFWATLNAHFLNRFIRPDDTVVDVGAGSLEFLTTLKATKKIAVDPLFTSRIVKKGISCYPSMKDLPKRIKGSVDVVMLSNVLEHLRSRDEILRILSDIRKLLKKDGSLLVIQPTIDLVGQRYWDFFDHVIPITRRSLLEALTVGGFIVSNYIPRFLPYTTKTTLPLKDMLLRIYLRTPWFLRAFAGQCFMRAVPKK